MFIEFLELQMIGDILKVNRLLKVKTYHLVMLKVKFDPELGPSFYLTLRDAHSLSLKELE